METFTATRPPVSSSSAKKVNSLRFCVSSSARLAQTQDGAVLLDIKQGLCFSLNQVGTVILTHIGQGRTSDAISRHLAETFNISPEQAGSDVEEFLEDLKRKNLVKTIADIQAPARTIGLFRLTLGKLRRFFNPSATHAG